MNKKFLIFSILFLVCFHIHAQEINILMLETTDIHGTIFPYDFIDQKETTNSMANSMSFIRQERAKEDQHVILLDAGDLLQGQPVAYYYNFEDTLSEHIFAKVMNYMRYDVATVGNHDIETGHPVYDRVTKEFKFPWLAANAININTGKPYWKPYEVLACKDVKIVVFGLTTPGIPLWLPENLWRGIEFEDMIESARKWVEYIKQNENPDILVGLFHSGLDYTYGGQTSETPKNENASLLIAEQVPGFDVIFAGHDHIKFNKFIENSDGEKVLLLNAASHSRYIAAAHFSLKKDSVNNSWLKNINGDIIDISGYDPDYEFVNKFNNEFEAVKNYISKPVVKINSSLDSKSVYFGSSALIDLIHQVQMDITDADVSFAAPLTYCSFIDSGQVIVSDLFKLYRFENLLYTISLTGNEIKDYLEYSYSNWYNTMKDTSDYLLVYKFDENNNPQRLYYPFYDFDSALGIKYVVDITKPVGERIKIASMQDGTDFDYEKSYKVAINSYRGNGGGGHLTRGVGIPYDDLKARVLSSTDKDLRFLMMKWLEKKVVITPVAANNWKLIPEDFVDYRREKESNILFPSYK